MSSTGELRASQNKAKLGKTSQDGALDRKNSQDAEAVGQKEEDGTG